MLLLSILFLLFLFVLQIIYATFSWGVTLFYFWYWFLLPVFPDLPQITFLHAVGLMLFIYLFKNKNLDLPIKDEYLKLEEKKNIKIVSYLGPWITLLMGWLVQFVISIV